MQTLKPVYTAVHKLASQSFFPKSRNQNGFFKQSTRLSTFSEEMAKWEFSTIEEVYQHGPTQFCVSNEDTLHLLSVNTRMFGLCTCMPHDTQEKKLFLDFSESIPVDKDAQLMPTSQASVFTSNEGKLALFLPSYDALFYFSPFGGTSTILRMAPSNSLLKLLGGRSQTHPKMYPSHFPDQYYFCGDNFIRILDTEEMMTLPLPQRGNVRPIGQDEFLVEFGNAGQKRALVAKNEHDEWIWSELETNIHHTSADWSVHRMGSTPNSFLQRLDFNKDNAVQVMHSPREEHLQKSKVAYSAKLVCSAFPTNLEVVTTTKSHIRTIPISHPVSHIAIQNTHVYTCSTVLPGNNGGGKPVCVVSKYETDAGDLNQHLVEWKRMWGLPLDHSTGHQLRSAGSSQVGATKPPPEASSPKHGKVDNKPHVGGNTWAGGTGGSDTAGLGGRGGPYRLDKGDPVHQLSDELKNQVDQQVLDKARELNRLAFEERLKEIAMNPQAHASYLEAKSRVEADLQRLRSIFELSNAQKKERVWEKNQQFGELDDSKLVDGLCGERQIYKRRVMKPPTPGSPSSSPLNVRLVVDISASMYRFQSMDGRLQRMVDSTLMMLEAVRGMESRFRLSIAGHSGEDEQVVLVDWDQVLDNEKKIWNVLEQMTAHAQYCMSGDTTVEAIKSAREAVLKQDEDQGGLVIVVSDANLRRYGIAPRELAKEMNVAADKVKTHVVFIASVRDEAEVWARELPLGKARVCLETSDLPHVMRDILLDAALE